MDNEKLDIKALGDDIDRRFYELHMLEFERRHKIMRRDLLRNYLLLAFFVGVLVVSIIMGDVFGILTQVVCAAAMTTVIKINHAMLRKLFEVRDQINNEFMG